MKVRNPGNSGVKNLWLGLGASASDQKKLINSKSTASSITHCSWDSIKMIQPMHINIKYLKGKGEL